MRQKKQDIPLRRLRFVIAGIKEVPEKQRKFYFGKRVPL